jgi:hypothetical protein
MMAEEFGYVSVARMLREVTSEELSEWQAYYILKQQHEAENSAAAQAKAKAARQGR